MSKRADGMLIKDVDPMVAMTPNLMPTRCEAQVFLNYKLDYEVLARYIVAQGQKGHKITFLELLIAAFVRTVADLPEVNRFIANKRLFSRTELSVSFIIVKSMGENAEVEENSVKCLFDPRDTIYDVADRVAAAIEESRNEEADSDSLKAVKFLTKPSISNPIMWLARKIDKHGWLPKSLVAISPFHTSLFIANMASIGMPSVNHHIYNFGTTTMFFSIGSVERGVDVGEGGKAIRKRYLPIGITADERVCAGAVYAKLVAGIVQCLKDPSVLEVPPEKVRYDKDNEYHVPLPKKEK